MRWVSPAGKIVREVRYPGEDDSWHINCLARHDGIWYATIFGAFSRFRGWAESRTGRGRIVELETGKIVAGGLSAPHSLRHLDGMWLLCNSEERELLALDAGTGAVIRRVACGKWTRGLSWDDRFLYVGACQSRTTVEPVSTAQVVVIDRETWQLIDRIDLPMQELYDLTFVSKELLGGLEQGFGTNPTRVAEGRQFEILRELGSAVPRTLWPSGDPLPWGDFRCAIESAIPASFAAGETVVIAVRVHNRSESFFTSAPPAPIYASYKWLDPVSGAFIDEQRAHRTKLPRTMFPNEVLDLGLRISVPERVGAARLRVTLMQEGVTWFDDQDADSALDVDVSIVPAEPVSGDCLVPAISLKTSEP